MESRKFLSKAELICMFKPIPFGSFKELLSEEVDSQTVETLATEETQDPLPTDVNYLKMFSSLKYQLQTQFSRYNRGRGQRGRRAARNGRYMETDQRKKYAEDFKESSIQKDAKEEMLNDLKTIEVENKLALKPKEPIVNDQLEVDQKGKEVESQVKDPVICNDINCELQPSEVIKQTDSDLLPAPIEVSIPEETAQIIPPEIEQETQDCVEEQESPEKNQQDDQADPEVEEEFEEEFKEVASRKKKNKNKKNKNSPLPAENTLSVPDTNKTYENESRKVTKNKLKHPKSFKIQDNKIMEEDEEDNTWGAQPENNWNSNSDDNWNDQPEDNWNDEPEQNNDNNPNSNWATDDSNCDSSQESGWTNEPNFGWDSNEKPKIDVRIETNTDPNIKMQKVKKKTKPKVEKDDLLNYEDLIDKSKIVSKPHKIKSSKPTSFKIFFNTTEKLVGPKPKTKKEDTKSEKKVQQEPKTERKLDKKIPKTKNPELIKYVKGTKPEKPVKPEKSEKSEKQQNPPKSAKQKIQSSNSSSSFSSIPKLQVIPVSSPPPAPAPAVIPVPTPPADTSNYLDMLLYEEELKQYEAKQKELQKQLKRQQEIDRLNDQIEMEEKKKQEQEELRRISRRNNKIKKRDKEKQDKKDTK